MSKYKVFIDGRAGTTGLRIDDVLAKRDDITLLNISPDKRKDEKERLSLIEEADITFLCLPESESKKISSLAPKSARIIDASTAHRTNEEWAYGLPELTSTQRESIATSNRVALPGCHASGFILMARPLIETGLLTEDHPFICHSITGYSGGGHNKIDEYEEGGELLQAPRQYALTQLHKHLPEMVKHGKLSMAPIFTPHISNYFEGMEVVIGVHQNQFTRNTSIAEIREVYEKSYANQAFVTVRPDGYDPEDGFLSAIAYSYRNDLEIIISGNEDRIVITARYDNLGKGACGAGVQCMNIMLDIEEGKGLL